MEERKSVARPIGYWIGWCIVALAVSHVPMMITGTKAMEQVPKLGTLLLMFSIPTALVLLVGGVGLVAHKPFGFYFACGSIFFGAFGGYRVPIIPFLKQYMPGGPYVDDLFLATNLAIAAVLCWEHFSILSKNPPENGQWQKKLSIALVVLGLAWVAVGRSMLEKRSGEANGMAELPVIGSSLSQLKTEGPVRFFTFHEKREQSQVLVFTGRTTEAAMIDLAKAHDLGSVPVAAAQSGFLPFVNGWRMQKDGYRTDFADGDLLLIGRLKDRAGMTLQIGYRKSDGSFTAQAMGITTPETATASK